MKKLFLTLSVLCFAAVSFAACGRQENPPEADFDVVSETGIVSQAQETSVIQETSDSVQASSAESETAQPSDGRSEAQQTPNEAANTAQSRTAAGSSSRVSEPTAAQTGESAASVGQDNSSAPAATDVLLPETGSASEAAASSETAEPSVGQTDERKQVFALVNSERAQNGLSALAYREDLQSAADLRAQEIVESFSHTRPDGTSCFTVIEEAGISYFAVGENIAYGQKNAEAVMSGWMNSSGHRANILSGNFTGIAVGMTEYRGVKYWVQLFIR